MIENLKNVILEYDEIQKCFLINKQPCDYKSLFGIEGEMGGSMDEGVILYGDIYTSDFSILKILNLLGQSYDKREGYDEISSMGRGGSKYYAEEAILGENGGIIIRNLDNIRNVEIKPMVEFMKKYPNYNDYNYHLVMNAFDNYYSRNK